jgi:hypothetical protein
MTDSVRLQAIFTPSEDIVAREIEGELIIVPLTTGFGDMEDELYTFNETGKAIFKLLDGQRDLSAVIETLQEEFSSPEGDLEADVIGLVTELVERGMLVEVKHD